ncbi:hydrogenase maturation nickel metallochaperone HypA [Longispora sp. K20-0274]|uniref:hydrogenase maturation nickel metallochaperone HypA/HybF n=1 Tax=Longispora sp. K20-0274 TaxID=3088255 RepID=UPI00399B0B80
MHELAITESVVASVRDRLGDARVVAVVLEVGRLSGVVPDAVRFCFDLCTEGTPLQGARLDIVDVPGAAYCRGCRSDVALADLIPLCPCGSADLDITRGQELRIRQVEVA